MHSHESPSRQRSGWFQSRLTTWVLLGFLAVGGFFLLTEHSAHVLGWLPYLLFLLCPLMMLFMHHGHGGHGGYDHQGGHEEQPPEGGQR